MPFKSTLKAIPGLMPLEIDLNAKGITWGDIGRFPLRQAFYDWGLKQCHDSVGIRSITQSSLNVLLEDELIPDALMPNGFIFHMSRCGSSILVRALSHGDGHLVISEPEPLNQLLFFLSGDLAEPLEVRKRVKMLRNMVLAFGRRRQLDNTHYFLKFSSWNVLFADAICSAFPGVPRVFLYRNPDEVMVSITRNATGFSKAKHLPAGEWMSGCNRSTLDAMSQEQFIAAVLARMMLSATNQPGMHFLDYAYVDAVHLTLLLDLFNAHPHADSILRMKKQFDFHSKDASGLSKFKEDAAEKQAEVTPAIRDACALWLAEPCRAIRESTRNVVC